MTKVASRSLLAVFVISLAASMISGGHAHAAAQQITQAQLEAKLEKQYATIENLFLHGPAKMVFPSNPRERRETMTLYSQPTSPPASRAVFGAGEVQKKARLVNAPAAVYTDEARAAKARGEVRLRLVLAADGTVKNIFPMKPLRHGLTEAAMEAARQIKFEPAIRNGQPASQFTTLSYEFKKGRGLAPYVPDHEFYF